MAEKLTTTYYRFLSEVRAFLGKLLKEPIKAQPSKYLKDRDFSKTKLIKVLRDRDILERHEKILDSTNSDEKVAKYVVKYKVKKSDFERKIEKIYIKYFEKNEPDKENLNECEGCDVMGGDSAPSTEGASAAFISNNSAPILPLGGIIRKTLKKGTGNNNKPENILGKTIAEKKKPKRIFITEKQYQMLMEGEPAGATTTSTVGDMGDYTAGGLVVDKNDPTVKGRAIKVKQFK